MTSCGKITLFIKLDMPTKKNTPPYQTPFFKATYNNSLLSFKFGMELAVKRYIKYCLVYISGGFTTMEKVKIAYPSTDSTTSMHNSSDSFILKSVVASLAGASIPAVIFYFLM